MNKYLNKKKNIEKKLKKQIDENGNKISPKLLPGLKNFLIDIDGVVSEDIPNEESERMSSASEIHGSKEKINSWYDEGHIITFFTSRSEDLREITTKWLINHKFKYHNIIFDKPRGGNYHYIDNTGVRATRFKGKFGDLVYKKKNIQVFE